MIVKKIVLALFIILIGLAIIYLFLPKKKIWVSLFRPGTDSPVKEEFQASFYYSGGAQPGSAKIFLGGQEVAEVGGEESYRLGKSHFESGSFIGIPVKVPAGMSGKQPLWVTAYKGFQSFTSDTARVHIVKKPLTPKKRSMAEIDKMRQFFTGPFNDLIIEIYNAKVSVNYLMDEFQEEYSKTWDEILAAGLPKSIMVPIIQYSDRVKKMIDMSRDVEVTEITLPISLLNAALREEGYPFYAYLYYLHFPLVTEIVSESSVKIGSRAYPVYYTQQVSIISGGWTPPTLYGHAASGNAMISEELHLAAAREFAGCANGDSSACDQLLGYGLRDMAPKNKSIVLNVLLREYRAATPGEEQSEQEREIQFKKILQQTTSNHEAFHQYEHFTGTKVPTSIKNTIENMGLRPYNKVDMDMALKTERRISIYLHKWSAEYNAYLIELIHAPNTQHHVLTFIYNRATSIYESRCLIFNLAKELGLMNNPEWILNRFRSHKTEWEGAYIALMQLEASELSALALKVYEKDFGTEPPTIVVNN